MRFVRKAFASPRVSRSLVATIALRRRLIGDTDEFSPVAGQH